MKKIGIFFNFSNDGKGGGGNQFLNYYKSELIKDSLFTENLDEATAVLINLNPLNFKFKRIYKLVEILLLKKKIILRVDGKLQLYREKGFLFDLACEKFLFPMADGIIFQSQWAFNLFDDIKKPYRIILNEANLNIYKKHEYIKPINGKLKILFSSWSMSTLKGYDFLEYLIQELDENIYSFTVIGQKLLPFEKKNVTIIKPMSQIELNKEFDKHNVYIFPSRNETCSNALLEAKAKGIPILAINDSGNKEIINIDSNLFNDKYELIQKIKDLTINYERYNNFKQNSESNVIEGYNRFIFEIKKINKNLAENLLRIFGFLILKPLFRLKKQRLIYKYLKKVLT